MAAADDDKKPVYFIYAIDDKGNEHPAGVWTKLDYACWSHSGTTSRGAMYNEGRALPKLRYVHYAYWPESNKEAPILDQGTLNAREMRARAHAMSREMRLKRKA